MGAGFGLQGQTITLGTPSGTPCDAADGKTPTSTVTVDVSWDVSAGNILEVELLGGAAVISTNPVLFNASTAGTNEEVSFTVLADGTQDVEIRARYRTPNTSPIAIVGTPQTTAQFDIVENSCAGPTETICTDGTTNSVTLTPSVSLDPITPNVTWYYWDDDATPTATWVAIPSGNYPGPNYEITVAYNQPLVDGTTLWSDFFYTNGANEPEARFYFEATDENGCTGELCIPITITAEVCHDLALTKKLNTAETAPPFVPGDDVRFTIEITNQGTRKAFDIDVVDYIPAGLINVDVLEATASFTGSPTNTTVTVPAVEDGTFTIEELEAGESVTIDITFDISSSYMEPSIRNAAEIAAFAKSDGGPDALDEDSTPDNDNGTNNGEVFDDAADNDDDDGVLKDDEIDEDGKNGGDEDDHDIQDIMITQTFDLALVKTEVSTGPYIPGNDAEDDVTFRITVYNQGTLDATNIEITDYFSASELTTPVVSTVSGSGVAWSGTVATIDMVNGADFRITSLEAGESVSIDVTFELNETFEGTTIRNNAEITAATNALGEEDEDSPLGTTGVVAEGDGEIDDEVADDSGIPGGTADNPGDQDDFDFDDIEVLQKVAIGNIVFFDLDGDGVFDAGDDDGIEDVIVELYEDTNNNGTFEPGTDTKVNVGPDGIPGTADDAGDYVTDADGYYYFDRLDPGDYFVYIPSSELGDSEPLDNLLSSIVEGVDGTNDDNADENGQNTLVNGGVVSTLIELALNDEPTGETGEGTSPLDYEGDLDDDNVNLTVDFGFTPEYRIGNLVWHDVDNDGLAEDGELGIPGVRVELYKNDGDGNLEAGGDDTFIGFDITDADGKYEFTGLYQGEYIVVIPDAGAPDEAGTGNNLVDYYSSTTNDPDQNSTGSLTGDDNNDNGAIGVTNATNGIDGLASAIITLGTGDSEPIDEQLRTDDATPDDTDGTFPTVPNNRSNVTVDFGFYQKVSLGDLVFFDTNNDGVFDADGVDGTDPIDDEYGIEGVTVRLLDGSGNPVDEPGTTDDYEVITNVNGEYLFEGLDPGDYRVEIVTPAGYRSSTGANAATGDYETAPDPDDTVGEPAYADVNNDDNGSEETTTTIRSGAVTLTSRGEPTDDGDADPNTNLTVDFGIVGYSLGNYVWLDDDNSGDRNGTEAGVNGVKVRLLQKNGSGDFVYYDTDPGTIGTQFFDVTTADDGFYFFGGLPAGEYKVQVLPENFVNSSGALDNLISSTGAAQGATPDTDGDQNDNGLDDNTTYAELTASTTDGNGILDGGVLTGVVTLGEGNGFAEPGTEDPTLSGTPGQDPASNSDVLSNLTVDFGFIPSMSVGSTVFADVNNNGLLDNTESGIDGVTVQLIKSGDDPTIPANVVLETTTANGGNYFFEGIPEGEYFIYLPNVGTELATTPKSSEPTVEDPDAAGDVDGDDNGIQSGGTGTAVQSGVFELIVDTEPTDGSGANDEKGPGSDQDNDDNNYDDNNGNMTIDFGFYQPMDFGDLTDASPDDDTDDYQTDKANSGPSHVIIAGLQIGATVDDEINGLHANSGTVVANGDDTADNPTTGKVDDEDGVDILAQTYKAGNTVNIPVTVTNSTGGAANLYAFVDWNGDGDFNDLGEAELVNVPNTGTQTILVQFEIPTDAQGAAINSTVGARFRLTTDDLGTVAADGAGAGAASEGAATDGEVEDYVLDITCPTGNCFDVIINVNEN